MGQMILSEPSIIITWKYQNRMEMDEQDILVGEMADGADEYFGLNVTGNCGLYFCSSPNY
jgi:hypothetical protein